MGVFFPDWTVKDAINSAGDTRWYLANKVHLVN